MLSTILVSIQIYAHQLYRSIVKYIRRRSLRNFTSNDLYEEELSSDTGAASSATDFASYRLYNPLLTTIATMIGETYPEIHRLISAPPNSPQLQRPAWLYMAFSVRNGSYHASTWYRSYVLCLAEITAVYYANVLHVSGLLSHSSSFDSSATCVPV